jgi:hypothetical protein
MHVFVSVHFSCYDKRPVRCEQIPRRLQRVCQRSDTLHEHYKWGRTRSPGPPSRSLSQLPSATEYPSPAHATFTDSDPTRLNGAVTTERRFATGYSSCELHADLSPSLSGCFENEHSSTYPRYFTKWRGGVLHASKSEH